MIFKLVKSERIVNEFFEIFEINLLKNYYFHFFKFLFQ